MCVSSGDADMQTQLGFSRTFPAVHCPICRATMSVTVVEAMPGDLNKIRYRCKECGVEMQHTYERDRDD
jgi:transposase-like protein